MSQRISVVISQNQSLNPAKKQLEENIVTELLGEAGIDVTVIPNLYDLDSDHTGVLCLSGIHGDLIVVSWLYPRAAHWTLDRHGIHGRMGTALLVQEEDPGEAETYEQVEETSGGGAPDQRREVPDRTIYCLDLRSHPGATPYVEEIKRIATELATETVSLSGMEPAAKPSEKPPTPQRPTRRWYPVIDYHRCTNCLECIDFCLFGVYGVDGMESILVEQPDNCRQGCPACSRVCPENAIIFPQHKTPNIAGNMEQADSLKIDLSQLFGAPEAVGLATQERDEQLVLAGRQAVGLSVGIAKRQQEKPAKAPDAFDKLINQLDAMDL